MKTYLQEHVPSSLLFSTCPCVYFSRQMKVTNPVTRAVLTAGGQGDCPWPHAPRPGYIMVYEIFRAQKLSKAKEKQAHAYRLSVCNTVFRVQAACNFPSIKFQVCCPYLSYDSYIVCNLTKWIQNILVAPSDGILEVSEMSPRHGPTQLGDKA
jgi:hypothetical protein